MNLQVVSPYKKCPYQCPFCVASKREENDFSDDFYNNASFDYIQKLRAIIKENNIETVVLTGDTEPTLFKDWIDLIRTALFPNKKITVELQTRNHKTKEMKGIDVLAFSHDKIPTFKREKMDCLVRDVFIYNKNLQARDIIKYARKHRKTVNQTTIKQMVYSSYCIPKVDIYIDNNKKAVSEEDKILFDKDKIKYDLDCNTSKNRYLIYRCDGKIYETWDSKTPL